MKVLLKTVLMNALIASILLSFSLSDVANAGNRGKGQVLRDGSNVGNSVQAQIRGQKGNCQQKGTNPNGGTGLYGDGTRPRPQDGTGFGARK